MPPAPTADAPRSQPIAPELPVRTADPAPPKRPIIVVASEHAFVTPQLREVLSASADLIVDPRSPADFANADAVVASAHRPTTAADLAAAPGLAVVTQIGTAVHVDLAAATALNIPVVHNPGQNADSVAEHTIALLLAVTKQIPRSDAEVRRREYWEVADHRLTTHELRGKTLGIVGFGAIGRRVAAIAAHGLGLKVIGFDARAGVVAELGFEEVGLDELLARSDVLSVHAALTATTFHLIDRERLSLLQPHAYVINTARAEVIDYDALTDLLAAGRLAGAGLDTWPGHRADPASALIDLPNVVLTQHNAGLTFEALNRGGTAMVAGLDEVLSGGDDLTSSILLNPEIWPQRRRPRARFSPLSG